MNAFEKHGLDYLSPSRINKWIEQPALCLLGISGIRDSAGPAAWRGTAADKAVTKAAKEDLEMDSLVDFALAVFDHEHKESTNVVNPEKVAKERKNVPDYVNVGVPWIRNIGNIQSDQGKVTCEFDGVPVPVIGYYDLLQESAVRDMKTGTTAPTSLKNAHGRQMAVYAKATKREPWIDFITRKEVRSFKVTNIPFWERQFVLAAQSLERVLSHSDDIFECCQLVYPDLDHWMWSDLTRSAARDIWNMEGL